MSGRRLHAESSVGINDVSSWINVGTENNEANARVVRRFNDKPCPTCSLEAGLHIAIHTEKRVRYSAHLIVG